MSSMVTIVRDDVVRKLCFPIPLPRYLSGSLINPIDWLLGVIYSVKIQHCHKTVSDIRNGVATEIAKYEPISSSTNMTANNWQYEQYTHIIWWDVNTYPRCSSMPNPRHALLANYKNFKKDNHYMKHSMACLLTIKRWRLTCCMYDVYKLSVPYIRVWFNNCLIYPRISMAILLKIHWR